MILFKIFPEDRPPPPFSKKFLSFTEDFLKSYDFSYKKVPCTFRKFQKTPTHPLGTLRDMFHQKSSSPHLDDIFRLVFLVEQVI